MGQTTCRWRGRLASYVNPARSLVLMGAGGLSGLSNEAIRLLFLIMEGSLSFKYPVSPARKHVILIKVIPSGSMIGVSGDSVPKQIWSSSKPLCTATI